MNDDRDLTRRVRKVLATSLDLNDADLPDDPSPQSLACWTSLRHMSLLAALEEEFAITFSFDDVKAMTSLGEITAHLRRHTTARAMDYGDLSSRLARLSVTQPVVPAHASSRLVNSGNPKTGAVHERLPVTVALPTNGKHAAQRATARAEAVAAAADCPASETVGMHGDTTAHPAPTLDTPVSERQRVTRQPCAASRPSSPNRRSGCAETGHPDTCEPHFGGLPHCLDTYIKSPGQTERKVWHWLTACWQLRGSDRLGRWTRVNGRVSLDNQGHTYIGERVLFHAHHAPTYLTTLPHGTLVIGDRTFVNFGADIVATGLVKIGSDCLIGTYVMMLDNDFHDSIDRARMPEPRPIIIGDEVWIGNRAIVLPGVTIGQGAIVGAGSVVVSDVPAWTVAAGNPARVIRELPHAPNRHRDAP
ncbi:MAG: hypothetical protein IT305_24085 [Chloroflexi bacterium]|nr:hypothetical protein [Chloroflexota bacterium]